MALASSRRCCPKASAATSGFIYFRLSIRMPIVSISRNSLEGRHVNQHREFSISCCARNQQSSSTTPVPKPVPAQHLILTRSKQRSQVRAVAELTKIQDETPTIKSFQFKLIGVMDDLELNPHYMVDAESRLQKCLDRFQFRPGQWVDFFVKDIPLVAGFSITSTPHQLHSRQTIELAIKRAYINPVVLWLHDKAQPGDQVQLRVGGDFFLPSNSSTPTPSSTAAAGSQSSTSSHPPPFAPSLSASTPILLIAGGVGATPMVSMVSHLAELNLQNKANQGKTTDGTKPPNVNAIGLFSARDVQELLFRDRLTRLADATQSGVDVRFFVTREGTGDGAPSDTSGATGPVVDGVHYGRVDQIVIGQCLEELEERAGSDVAPLIYMCGPAVFEQAVLRYLDELGVPPERIMFEKWW